MTKRTIAYFAATALFAFPLLGSGAMAAALVPEMADNMTRLGFAEHFTRILGIWKILGVAAVLAPGLGFVKEWAYAGFFFTLTGASLGHYAVGDGLGEVLVPMAILGMGLASYTLRPDSRRANAPAAHAIAELVPAK